MPVVIATKENAANNTVFFWLHGLIMITRANYNQRDTAR
mgnify:CR=1 FL=1